MYIYVGKLMVYSVLLRLPIYHILPQVPGITDKYGECITKCNAIPMLYTVVVINMLMLCTR